MEKIVQSLLFSFGLVFSAQAQDSTQVKKEKAPIENQIEEVKIIPPNLIHFSRLFFYLSLFCS